VVARHALGSETICTVAVQADVASALIAMAGPGKQTGKDAGESRCVLIALATHGRSGVQRLVLGSVTERVLSSAMVPLLIVRPLAPHMRTS
jgi:nucleotide-binding universal stress UspA family protein